MEYKRKLKIFIKEIVAIIYRYSGIVILIREVFCRNKVTIIVYHNPSYDTFKRHINYLSKNYNFISLNRFIYANYTKNWSIIPPKSLIITIDDGYKDNFKLLKIFKMFRIYPTIYLCSHIVNTNRKFWWKTGFKFFKEIKNYKNTKKLEILKNTVRYELRKEYSVRQSLNLKELNKMALYVDFQSHSKFHPILTTCSDEECKEEIKGSKDYLERLLRKKIIHFCYPNGDYSKREIQHLKRYGYKSGRTLDFGWNNLSIDPYRLRSLYIEDDASINVLSAEVCGIINILKFLRYMIKECSS
ncbi:MAG: polysaccharide deacetylase family protein [Promethearchaeota archaeon]